ncbi:hypothetical protein FALCPG4_005846 [Fusarium falciforme]
MADRSLNPGPAMGASTAAQLYNTVPIPRNSQFIRVLDIPAQNSALVEGLTGTLRAVDLRDSPKYTALSYTWGESSNKSITCNGHYVAITDSCFKALSSLRKALGSFTIWVDAICINQMDNDEKSTQIRLMRKIYTWAKNVYLWLGLGTGKTKEALDFVKHLSQHRLFPAAAPWRRGNRPMMVFQERVRLYRRMLSASRVRNIGHDNGYSFPIRHFFPRWPPTWDWNSFVELVDQAWLQRSWTFQEIALASNPVLVFGQDHISWLDWYHALAWVYDLEHRNEGHLGILLPATASWRALKKWIALFSVWETLPRPCGWNGDRFRQVLDEAGDPKDDCSVRDYLQALDTRRARRLARLSAFLLHVLTTLVLLYPRMALEAWVITQSVSREFHPMLDDRVFMAGKWSTLFICLWFMSVYGPNILRPPWQKFCRLGQPDSSEQRGYLVGVIRAMRERECSLKEDRVFAVGAILECLGVRQPTADYNRSTGEIYQESFTGLVEWDSSFISLLIDTGSCLPGAPSWVPDWSTVAERSWLSSSYIYDSVQVPRWSTEELSISISGGILSVQVAFLRAATHCTTLSRKVEVDPAGDATPGMEESLLHNIQALCQWVMRVRRDMLVDSIYDSVPLGVLGALSGHHIDRSEIDPDTQQVFNNVYTLMRRHSAQLEKELETMTGIVPATRATFHDMAADKPNLGFIIDTCNELAGKRGLFLCSDGSMGSGPEAMLEGDLITLVKGVDVPMILRRQSDDTQRDVYTVVGPSYIDGLMRFDAKGWGDMNLDWEQIDLI